MTGAGPGDVCPLVQRILVVDDDEEIRLLLSLTLTRLGDWSVEVCSSGLEAIARAPAFAPHLILLDVMMPQLDGVGTLHRLRALPETATVPVVFVTARCRPSELQEYRALGVADVIVKPFDPIALVGRIRQLWAELHAS